ncbi:ABC transporter substrate-binding protein [Immundisolibacter sp.]|uniref:ABC transporter substrate-binding protein n=1 Tax=Immundisolibacter sp. TaxID=1934948 RepID=UPI0035613EFE
MAGDRLFAPHGANSGAGGMMAVGRLGRQRGVGMLAGLLWLAGCGQAQYPATPVLRMGLAQPVLDLDPRRGGDAASARVARLLYSRLIDLDATYQPRPAAADWQQLDTLHYRLTLRQPVPRFGDGSRLVAADVVATYRAVLDPAAASPLRAELGPLASVHATADGQIDFTLSQPDALFPGRLTLGILPARCAGSVSATPPCHYDGSGPFALETLTADRVRLRRRSDDLGLEFQVVPDPTVRVLKLLRGELDLLQNDLPPELLRELGRRPGVQVVRAAGSSYHYLGFNLADPVTGDLRVRQAVAHAIDREALVRYLLAGAAVPAGSVLPPGHYAAARLLPYEYDPALARRLLAEAGLNSPRLVYKTSTDPVRIRIATALQAQLAAAGIRVQVQSHEWGSFFGDVRAGRFQLYSLAWVGIRQPDALRHIFHSGSLPPGGANRGRFANPAVDALLDAAARTSGERQAALYRQAQITVHEALPYVPLWYEDNVYVARAGVRGYMLRPDGAYDALEFTEPPHARDSD